MPKKKTLDDFLNELKRFPDYEYLEGFTSYSRAKVKMRHNCEKCGNHEFEVIPRDFISEKTKRRCDICSGSRVNTASFKWFIKEHGLEDEYEVLGEVVDNKTKVKMRHLDKDCEDPIFEMTPDKFKSGSRCHNCANKRRSEATKQIMTEYYKTHNNPRQKSHETFLSEVDEINKTLPDGEWYEVIGTYTTNEEHVDTIHHLPDGSSHKFDMHPNHFINGGTRCKVCNGNNFLGTENFSRRVTTVTNGEYMVVPGSVYKGSDKHIMLRHNCEACNYTEWPITPVNFNNGRRCPICACNGISQEEKELRELIESLTDTYSKEVSEKILNGKEIDILTTSNIGFELNGLYWHSELYKSIDYHLKKTDEASNIGIDLIHIFEDEWLYKREIVSNYISILLDVDPVIDNYYVSTVDDRDKDIFLNTNDIEGTTLTNINLGLYNGNDNLVAIMCFNKLGNDDYDLCKFTCKFNVPDAYSELFNYFTSHYQYNSITMKLDRRWNIPDRYIKLGWNLVKNTEPKMWYQKDTYRYKVEDVTDDEFDNNGRYHRIYDCGYSILKYSC